MNPKRIRLKFTSDYPLKYGVNAAAEFDNSDWPRFVRITDVTATGNLREDTFRSLPPETARGYELEEGDILFARSGATVGKTFIYEVTWGDACYAGYLIRSRTSTSYSSKYLYWYCQSAEYWAEIQSNLIQATIQNFSAEKYANIRIPLLDLEIQKRIADFLDEKTTQIDALIEKKRALLDRLAEKRQALITQAVTKGLNPTAPMKDSGIAWLGEIPAHWEVKRLKYISPRVSVGIVVTPAAYYVDDGVLALRGLNVKTMSFDLSETRNISVDGNHLNRKSILREGDLVAVRTGAPGTTAIVSEELAGCNCIDLVIIRKPENAAERFIGWFLNSERAKVQYSMGAEGALQQHFNVETSKELLLTLPTIREQLEISAYIDSNMTNLDSQYAMIEESMSKLFEYRSALITAAVTGQIEALQ